MRIKICARVSELTSFALLTIIKVYRQAISPILPARCRYYPTCSEYGLTAIKWHGPSRGGILTVKRVCRCQPFGGHGVDFVPLPLYKYSYQPSQTMSTFNNSIAYGWQLPYVPRETILIERGVYVDRSSYRARLNHCLSKLG